MLIVHETCMSGSSLLHSYRTTPVMFDQSLFLCIHGIRIVKTLEVTASKLLVRAVIHYLKVAHLIACLVENDSVTPSLTVQHILVPFLFVLIDCIL